MYFEFGPAVLRHKAEVEYYSHYSDAIEKWGLAANLGFFFPVGKNFAFDAGADLLHKPGWVSDGAAGGILMGLHAGIAVFN